MISENWSFVFQAIYKVVNELRREDPEEKTDEIFKQMDVNCDDKLSLDEFITGIKKDSYIADTLEKQL